MHPTNEQIEKILEREYIKDAIYKHGQVLVFTFGHDGKFIHVSESVVNAVQYTKEEIVNEPFIDKVYEDDKKRTIDIYSFFNKTNLPGYSHYINRYVSKCGDLLNIFWLRPVRLSDLDIWVNTAILLDEYTDDINHYCDGYTPFNWE